MTERFDGSSSARLERALEIWLAHADAGAIDRDALLAQHPDLRDMLEPMLDADAAHADAPRATDPAEPTVLGDFRLLRELGRGGMGIVHEAWQRSLDRHVALKVLAPALADAPSSIARFRREAAAVAKLRHPGVVEIHGFGSDGGRHWFAMELVDGLPLQQCSERFRTPATAVALVAQVLDALQHSHGAGLVHRDVKPGNILVRADGTAVLTDFGLASDAALPSMTASGGFVGTLDYASPEQLQGQPIDARTDVWSTGVVLYELLAGARPFARPTTTTTMKAILTADAPDLRRVAPSIPADLAAIVDRALQKDPARRYPSAVAFLADLRAFQNGGVVSARLPSAPERLARWARREPWRAATALVVLLAVPALASLGGYLAANTGRIAAATAAETAARREQALGRAFWHYSEFEPDEGLAVLDALAPDPGDAEIAVTRAMLLRLAGRLDDARAVLANATVPAARLAREAIDGPLSAARLDHDGDADAFECLVRGLLWFEYGISHGDDPEPFRRGVEWSARAVALSPSPRVTFLLNWHRCAVHCGDVASMRAADAALAAHFPDSDRAVEFRTLAKMDSEPERAVEEFRAILASGKSRRPSLRYNLGVSLERLRRDDEAAIEYRAVVAAVPTNGRAWNNLGMILRRKKDEPGAVEAFRQATRAAPSHAKAWGNLGSSLRSIGEIDAARAALQRAIELKPDYAIALTNLGNLLHAAGEHDAAIDAYQRAIRADPKYVAPVANLGDLLARLDRKQEALVLAVRATELAPNALIPQFNLARMAHDLGLLQLALPAARRASEVGGDRPHGHAVLAEVLLTQPNVDATAALQHAIRADTIANGELTWVRVILAKAHAAAGERERAIAILETLLANPKFTSSDHRHPEAVSLLKQYRDRK